jgi:hypothetical protein
MFGDLVDWLQAQLDDEERGASEGHERGCAIHKIVDSDLYDNLVDPDLCNCRVRHRLLDIGARRRLLEDYADAAEPITEHWQWRTIEGAYAAGLEHAVRDLALAYADRQGYHHEWRP